jgi:probable blue pigment (indigoidine) exporter
MIRFYTMGVLFALVWSSASVAAKVGLRDVQPLVLYQWRFIIAAVCLLLLVYLVLRNKLPKGKEWGQLAIFGLLNVTIALGLFALAIKEVAAGIGALQVGLNPLIISIMTSIVAKKRIESKEYLAVFLGIAGVAICVYPLLLASYATIWGLFLLGLSTLAYSGAAVYFSTINWRLEKLTINAWQVFFGAIFLLPVTFLTFESTNSFQADFFYSVIWLGVPVSIGAVFLWLWLLSEDSVRASFFLFLCPAFGLLYAYFILEEPFTLYTLIGLMVVMIGLWVGKRKKRTPNQRLPLD